MTEGVDKVQELPRTIGTLEAKIDRLEEDVQRLYRDQQRVLTILNRAEGGWKAMVIVGGFAGAVGAAATKIITMFVGSPK